MAGKRQRKNGTWEYVFKKSGVLEKPIYMSFDTEDEGDAYAVRLEKLLEQGIVPIELQPEGTIYTIERLDREYQRDAHPSDKDREKLSLIVKEWGKLPLHSITATWVDAWIDSMKREAKLAPATIRARVGALARATDWAMRKGYVQLPDHPLRSLPNGYAQYTQKDAAIAGVKREDIERDRRLERGEFERIMAILDAGIIQRKQKNYTIPYVAESKMFILVALETAMRMREIYTLTVGQVDFEERTIFLDKTKNGSKRQVPLSSVMVREFRPFVEALDQSPTTIIFPFWTGDAQTQALAKTSDWASSHFKRIFEAASCEGLRFHDLRHEATSRFFERTKMTEAKIAKITGHKSMRMLMRYANLRGTTLADELW